MSISKHSQNTIMKKRLRDKFPLSIKNTLERWITRVMDDLLHIATSNGLDLSRFSNHTKKKDVLHRGGTLEDNRHFNGVATATWGAKDFLFMMDLLYGKVKRPVPPNKAIKCSIVIPVFNKIEFTFQCLRSLLKEIDLSENEVIVVDNASEEETELMLSYMNGWLRVIKNIENEGFVKACNQGAAIAQGKYVIFLNNDTTILPGWLKYMVETIENDAEVGAVGSMLVYPDGRLQEAGGIIWRDGSGMNYGRNKDPDEHRFRYARNVDYCSGASLLVRKDLFDKLHGFDERYVPAYYEDTDLCFGIRSLGFKIIYQPMSRLIHYEGITAGTDIQSGFKRYQEINRAKFVEKWHAVLEKEHYERGTIDISVAAERRKGPRVLVIDVIVPTPDQDSGSLRMAMILKMMSKWARPTFMPMYPGAHPEYEGLCEKDGIEIIYPLDLENRIRPGEFKIAIISRADVANVFLDKIKELDPQIKIIYDTVDVHFLRLMREYELNGDVKVKSDGDYYKQLETRMSDASDEVWCVTLEDEEVLKSKSPRARFRIIPNIHILNGRGKTYEERDGLLFIGGFAHPPNGDAVHYFMMEIYPLLLNYIPGIKFYIVGSKVPEDISAYNSENVVVTGYVPDVSSFFESCKILVAPLRYGAGMKGKVGQALSYGLPVVTTNIGAEGIGLRHDYNVMISDNPVEFADLVINVYNDKELWQRLSDNGYRHIQDNFTPDIIDKKIKASIAEHCGSME